MTLVWYIAEAMKLAEIPEEKWAELPKVSKIIIVRQWVEEGEGTTYFKWLDDVWLKLNDEFRELRELMGRKTPAYSAPPDYYKKFINKFLSA